ncbi:gas vesicle accessory protein GvpU [Metabacillus schmidteae]|uniref:gas vesicle accessory protein GvpU n=1 Tax=Metabacillus schmidteae TaxID=2730405 RepID=UPI000C7F89B8|nr:gas vesicle accessory protein GvpU [Metabacillus schmidteae]
MAKEQTQMSTNDAIMLMFLDLVEQDGIEVGVTLSVKGAIISGILIGATAYYEGITEASKNFDDSTMSKIISKKFHDLKEEYAQQKQQEAEKESKDKANPFTFIHLKDAKYLNSHGELSHSKGTWWRGKIESIDGFSFNSFV